MRKRRLIKINKIILCVIAIIVLITLPTFGRYIYNNVRDLYLKSHNFSFSSNLLTTSGKTYKYSNWSGIDEYEIDFQLYSYENELSLFTYADENGLKYNIQCTIDDPTKATAHVNAINGDATGDGYIPNSTNIKDVKIYLKATENLTVNDTIKLTVTASTTVPYKKTIKADFEIKLNKERISYKMVDSANSIYTTLELVNANSEIKQITLTYNPEEVMIDKSDEAYTEKDSETLEELLNDNYKKSVTFKLGKEQSKNIKFYKADKTKDYTYPNINGDSMVVEVQAQTVTE